MTSADPHGASVANGAMTRSQTSPGQISPVQTSPAQTSPAPTDEEAVAITAAMEALWPRAATPGPEIVPRSTAWRFSSRNWSRPLPVRRLRPWR